MMGTFATSADASSCPLSVVIGTTQPWPEAQAALDSVYDQAEVVRAEVLLAIKREDGRPPLATYPNLKIVEGFGETIFELRMRAIAKSSGEIVSVTEDHCRVAPDWCQRVIDAHEQFPEADVIGGAVANGACDAVGWAGFLISNGAFLPPLETREQSIVTAQANVSFKRRALWGWGAGGLDDGHYRAELRKCGGHLFIDGRVQVSHVQWLAPLAMCVCQFHGGRSIASRQRAHLSRWQWLRRLIKVSLLPVRIIVNTPRLSVRAGLRDSVYLKPAVGCQLWLLVVHAFYYLGELTGHLFGPGSSPYRLR